MTMLYFRRFIQLLAALVLSLGLNQGLSAQESPSARIETAVNNFLAILQDKSLAKEEKAARIRAEAFDIFDERAMAQSVLSSNWRTATPEQQQEFQRLFAELLENTYIDRLDAYTNQTARVLGEQVNGTRASVNTMVLTDTANVPVTYRMRQVQGEGWLIYDVEVENVSLVNSYRETYLSVVNRQGMEGLLQQMRDKLAELQRQQVSAG